MSIKNDRLLIRASKLLKKGNNIEAKKLYSSILKSSPGNLEAQKALSIIEKENTKKPAQKQLDEVIEFYSQGQIDKAQLLVKNLLKNFPMESLLYNILGACYSEAGPIDSAIENFEQAIALKPDYAEAYYNLGVAYQKNGKINNGLNSYEKAVELKHAYPQAHNNIGLIKMNLGNLDSAVASLEWATAYSPNYAEAHNNLGAALQKLTEYKKAKVQYEKAIKINPNYAQALNNLGSVCEILGLESQALDSYIKAIEKDPSFTVAHRNLSAIKKYSKNDPHIGQMEALYSKTYLSLLEKRYLCFALAKVYEDLGNNDKFFNFLNEGNQIRKKELNYSFSSSLNLYSNLLKAFKSPPEIISKSIKDSINIRPIFIVGMPRSGTTLVEQIISSHNAVHGAGELNNLKNVVTPIFVSHLNSNKKILSKKNIQSIRQQYLDSIQDLNSHEKVITDKMPINFWFIGFILSALPEAKIIHIKRDARATCWSNYKHCFNSGNGFSFNQDDLSQFYVLYSKIIDFWHKLFPNKIYDLSYEELTVNQKTETEKLLNYCDLEWDANCLEFYKNNRAIKTASASQVRQKMYQGSSEAWKEYEPYIETIISGLKGY